MKRHIRRGIRRIELDDWEEFIGAIEMVDCDPLRDEVVYRGHADPGWRLLPSIDRERESDWEMKRERYLGDRLNEIERQCKGCLSEEPKTPEEFWALAQHYGSETHFLDWTTCPRIGAFFAVSNYDEKDGTLWCLHHCGILAVGVESAFSGLKNGPPLLTKEQPFPRNNKRCVAQQGLFTRFWRFENLEEWVESMIKGDEVVLLSKITIPAGMKSAARKWLENDGITTSTVYPENDAAVGTLANLQKLRR